MAAKHSRLLGILFLVGSIILVPSGNAPQKQGPETAQPKALYQKEASAATSGDRAIGATLTRARGSETDDTAKSLEPSYPSKKSHHDSRQELRSAESVNSKDQPGRTPVAKASAILGDRALDGLVRDTKDQDWKVRWDAVNELGKLKDPRAVPALVDRALYDDNSHPRWRSLWALKAVDRSGSHAIPLLRSALLDPRPEVVRNAAVALAFFGQGEARPELLNGLNDYDEFRRWEAVFSLRGIGSAEVARLLAPLLRAAVEPNEGVRSEVALTLGYMGDYRVILPLVAALQTDPSPEVRWRAAMTLSKVGELFVIGDLEQAMAKEGDPQVRRHIEGTITTLRGR